MKISIQNFQRVLDAQGKTASYLRQHSFSPATITRIRRGLDVSARTARKLAKVLNVPIQQLLETDSGVVIDRVKLTAMQAGRGLVERQLFDLAGVSPYDTFAIHNDRAISPGTAWRIADTLGIPLEQIL